MAVTSSAPDIAALHIPKDVWTEPFWAAAEEGTLRFPRCSDCGCFRWPPGPFCPTCQSQAVEWIATDGRARLYTFTIVPHGESCIVPALVEFDGIAGVRLLTAIVDTQLTAIRAGAVLTLDWSSAENARVPVFRAVTS